MRLSVCEKIYYTFLWLFNNKLGTMEDNTSEVKIPMKVPDYEYETLARSFLPFILDYFSKEENIRDFEDWKARRKLKNEQRVQA